MSDDETTPAVTEEVDWERLIKTDPAKAQAEAIRTWADMSRRVTGQIGADVLHVGYMIYIHGGELTIHFEARTLEEIKAKVEEIIRAIFPGREALVGKH